jgi:hypothetical protein
MQTKITKWAQFPKHKIVEGLRVSLTHNLPHWIVAKDPKNASLIRTEIEESNRPCIWVDMSKMTKPGELTQQLWQKAIDLYGWKKFSELITDLFKDVNSAHNSGGSVADALIQGTFRILEALSGEDRNLVVVLEEPEAARRFVPQYSQTWLDPAMEQNYVKFVLVSRSVEGTGIPVENKVSGSPDREDTDLSAPADFSAEEWKQQILRKKFSELTLREKEALLN